MSGQGVSAPGGGVWSGVSAPGGVSGPEGGVWSRGVSTPGGVWSGGCLLQGRVCSWGVSGLGGCLLRGGAGGIPACTEADTTTPPPVDRQTPVKT